MGTVPQNLPGCPTGAHPTSGRAVPGALPAGTPSLPALRCCLLPTCQPEVSLSPGAVCQHPQRWWHWAAATPLPIFPREGTPQQPPEGTPAYVAEAKPSRAPTGVTVVVTRTRPCR